MHIFENMFLNSNYWKKSFLRAIIIQEFRISTLEYPLSKMLAIKWTELKIFSEDVILLNFTVLL